MERFLGDAGLGCLTLLPAPLAVLVLLGGWLLVSGLAGLMVLGCVACFGGMLALVGLDYATGHEEHVRVTGHSWSRSVAVEVLVADEDDGWCDDVPDDAEVIRRESRFHHRDRRRWLPDVDVYEDHCVYRTWRWRVEDEVVDEGTGTRLPRGWPVAPDDGCEREGCRRPGRRTEELHVVLDDGYRCQIHDRAQWRGWTKGDEATVVVGGLGGRPYCATLTAVSSARASAVGARRR